MNRKTFLKKTAGALLLAIPAYVLISCSSSSDSDGYGSNDDDDDDGNDPNCLENGANGNISANHGHSLTVSSVDVNSGEEKTYSIAGTAGHSHNVTVTVANFNTLKNNQQITLGSTTQDDHTHQVTVSCA